MRSSRWTTAILPLLVAALSLAARTERAMNQTQSEATPAPVPLTRWLVLGPVVDPLPTFHDEKPGSYGVEDLLKAERFPARPWRPTDGAEEAWFGGGLLRWKARDAGPGGLVSLAAPEGTGKGRPATAWLSAYLTVARFTSLDLEVIGTHPRRAWLDGDQVAIGGTETEASKPADVKGKLELTTGKHLLVLKTVFDPARAGEWTLGASLRFPGEGSGEECHERQSCSVR